MERLAEIRQKLLKGDQPRDLIKEGYKKSSVYAVAKTLRGSQLSAVEAPGADALGDELADLRHKKEVVKLEKEIDDIQSGKGTALRTRVSALEWEVKELRELIRQAGKALFWDAGQSKAKSDEDWDNWFEKLEEFVRDNAT